MITIILSILFWIMPENKNDIWWIPKNRKVGFAALILSILDFISSLSLLGILYEGEFVFLCSIPITYLVLVIVNVMVLLSRKDD